MNEFRGDVRGYIAKAENNGPAIAYSENTFILEVGRMRRRSVQSLVTQIREAVKANGFRVSATKQSEGDASVHSLSPEMPSHPYIIGDTDEQHLPRVTSDPNLNPPPPITDNPALEKKLSKLSPGMFMYLVSLGGNTFDDLEKSYLAFSDVTTLLATDPTISPDMKAYITDLQSKHRRVV